MPASGRREGLPRRFGILATAIVLAVAAAWQAAALSLSGPNPAMVFAIDRTHPVALPRVVDQLSAADKKPGMPRERMLGLIRSALKRDALTPRAIRQLAAWEEARGRVQASRELLEVGARVGRRDPLLNVMLAKDAARDGRGATVVSHLDAALSTFREADREVFPLLGQLIVNPEMRRNLGSYMDRPWAGPFMLYAAQNVQPLAVLDLALSAPKVQTSPQYGRFRSELISHLASGGAADRAIAYALLTSIDSAKLAAIGISPATIDPQFAPVTWRLRNHDGLYVTGEGNKLIVAVDPAARGRALERLMDLAPGRYGLSVASTAPPDLEPVIATWTVNCLRGNTTASLAARDDRIASGLTVLDFVVPPNCGVVQVLLDLVSRSDQRAVEYSIDAIRLSKKAR